MNAHSKAPTIITSRDFNQNTASAKRAAEKGPVFVTSRGEPTHVLLTKEEYDRLDKGQASASETPQKKPSNNLADALADPRPEADFDWEPPRMGGFSLRVPDFE